jgi:hypothetical protein
VLTVNGLIEMTVKENILDIQLMDWLGVHGGNAQNEVNGGRLNHWTESLCIINTVLLGEATDDPSSLLPCERAVRIEFVAEYPFVGHHIDTLQDEQLKTMCHSA